MRVVLILGVTVLGLVVCSTVVAQQAQVATLSSEARSTDERLREFLEGDWKYWMTEYPEEATGAGYPGYSDRWTDYSLPAITRRNTHLFDSLRSLKALASSQLSPAERLNYDLYEQLLENAIEGLRFHDDAFPLDSGVPRNLYIPLSQKDGVPQDVPYTIAMMPRANSKDYDDIVARLNGVPALVKQTIALMQNGIAHGWSPPKIILRDVPQQLRSQIVIDPLTSPLLGAFKRIPVSIPPDQRESLVKEAIRAYQTNVVPAFEAFIDYLTKTYIPACRDTVGLESLPKGADYYRFLVRRHTTTNMTADEIHQLGLNQIRMIRAEMMGLMAQSKFQGTFADFVRFLNQDPQFFFANRDDLILHYRALAKQADPELARLFHHLPRLPYGVKAVPDAIAPSQTGGYYEPGSPAVGRPAYFNANTYGIESRPKWQMEVLMLHEAVPGHHIQVTLAQEMDGLPEFRKALDFTAFVEGWALYAETLGGEMGFYGNPYTKFGYLSMQMRRAVRLVVDTGMHSMSWTREQGIRYLAENTGLPAQEVVSDVDRYIARPGQALGYMIGELKILELRAQAEKELGNRFDLRSFHDAVLAQGAVPLNVLHAQIRDWIVNQRAGGTLH